jgi:hypothetical protein
MRTTARNLRSLLALLALVGCGPPAGVPREPDQYAGCGSDEHWKIFDLAEPGTTLDAARAPLFLEPTAGATLPAAPSPRIAWQPTSADPGHDFGDATCSQCTVCGLAPQHWPPITGTAYDLHFVDGDAIVYRVVTTLQVWTPPDALWAGWRGRQVTLRAWRLPLQDNQPYEGIFASAQPLAFSVAP